MNLSERISQYWQGIQGNLFPWLAEELGPLSEKQQQLVTVLEVARIEQFIPHYRGYVGRPQDDRVAIARAFVAKAVYGLKTTRQLIDRLSTDIVVRRICGFEKVSELPSESTFSRAFAEFANSELASRVHAGLIKEFQSERLVGHLSRDSTAIEAPEKALYKAVVVVPKVKLKRGRPKKGEVREERIVEPTRIEQQLSMSLSQMLADLPKACDVGTKRNSKGYQTSWKGYKLHLDSADGGIPISAILSSASVHDSQVALPLAKMSAMRVTNCYDLMDAAYDSSLIRDYSNSLGHVPLIDFNHRSPMDTRCFAPHEKQRYKERSTAERANSRLKGEFGALTVWVRGHAKVMSHLMWGIIVLTVDALGRCIVT